MQQKDVEVLWRDFLLQDFGLLLPVTLITGPPSRDERPERHHRRSRSPPPVDGIVGGGGSATSQVENRDREKGLERRAQHGTCARGEEAGA